MHDSSRSVPVENILKTGIVEQVSLLKRPEFYSIFPACKQIIESDRDIPALKAQRM
ncbi:hypothetical protein SAMN06265173_11546 [Thalassovita litoralis]|uniref:Uncharacterized protein n=1 Tax=Thalassovita litoralis TaxID=1010611 RepID=A0A521EAD6_9RHOB|nr:hypothetical protein SAMN06265173_11546 [Thalassovita litoralis]